METGVLESLERESEICRIAIADLRKRIQELEKNIISPLKISTGSLPGESWVTT